MHNDEDKTIEENFNLYKYNLVEYMICQLQIDFLPNNYTYFRTKISQF